jgi:hypothetical protein
VATKVQGKNGGDAVAANFGSAANTSNGSAQIWTGNANAAGNQSTTNVSQTVDANLTGGLVLPDQTATVNNTGIGIANTGLNVAVGNLARTNAAVVQAAATSDNSDDTVASNFGDVANSSNGSAAITSGNADSIGNASGASTNVAQTVDTNGADMVLSDQVARSNNTGIAASNTGLNAAVGNASTTASAVVQAAAVSPATGDAVASNFGDASSNSNGDASITTGNASAVGSEARTNVAQTVNADGANGFVLSDQRAVADNFGVGVANTGLNLAVGNAAGGAGTAVVQAASVSPGGNGDTVAANFGSATTQSDGSATIHSGNASAVGTRSATNVAQTVDMNGTGFNFTDQRAVGTSIGVGIANSGGNIALGNVSRNNVAVVQASNLPSTPAPNADDVVASNDGIASTTSNGRAEITTGSASATGNESTTNIAQTSDVNGAGFAFVDQNTEVNSIGVAAANSGLNIAVGNASANTSALVQSATVSETGTGSLNAGDVVANNGGTANSTSNGSARITTGSADATGNASTTNVAQSANFDGKGFAFVDQNVLSRNWGIGVANSGLNAAVGNASRNNAAAVQSASVRESDRGDLNADDIVAANSANNGVNSNGSADITTGAATATGNASTTSIAQIADTNIAGSGFTLVDQNVRADNAGLGIANSGINAAVGNASRNNAATVQQATVREADRGNLNADDIVAVNNSNNSANSNGSASISTGAADATGNKSATTVNQVADTNIAGSGFVLNDQNATVDNVGLAVGNSGVNLAVGNASRNNTSGVSNAQVTESRRGNLNAGDVVASNSANNLSNSDGSASITTGAARAIGNDSATTVNQVSDNTIAGIGFVLGDQSVNVVNAGLGIANSGVNVALGNVSRNRLLSDQNAVIAENAGKPGKRPGKVFPGNLNVDDAVAANDATTTNNSNGSAKITTGDTEGVGNRSATTLNQFANNNITKGFDINKQVAIVVNAGVGVGNSGINLALGNASRNANLGNQTARISERGAGNLNIDGDAVAANTNELTNASDGSASITTGCGFGTGNTSSTNLTSNGPGGAAVFNVGIGVGNSGINAALGNASNNRVVNNQLARVSETGPGDLNASDDVVAANTGSSTNWSRGSASITTGIASGYGNTSTTTLDGEASDGLAIVVNLGIGVANTGLNAGIGNASNNVVRSNTTARIAEGKAGDLNLDDDGVATNIVTGLNDSDGKADLTTGDAYALGNRSATGIVDPSDATTINFGLAFANTGLNIGAGNVSDNKTRNDAISNAPGGVATNVATPINTSNGTATIHTGNAVAFGNVASNATCQGVDFGPSCPQPTLPDVPVPCTCGQKPPVVTPPPVQPPTCPDCGPKVLPKPVPSGPVLARTGVSVELQALLGLLLLAIGVFLRRKARTA